MSDAVQDRPYQTISRDRCFERWEGGDRSTLLVLPTGTGKTVVSGMIAKRARQEYSRRALFVAHREELITQAEDKLRRFDLTTTIEMGEQKAQRIASLFGKPDVVIATVQTLQGERLRSWDPEEFGLIIVDEAHHARATSYRNMLDHFKGYWLLGITATPDRGDGRNLGAVFESIAHEYPLRTAIEEEYLVPIVAARLMTRADLKQIRTTGGDLNDADLAARIAPHIQELADAIVQECGTRPTIIFCPDVRCSEVMAETLTRLGVAAEAVSGKMKKVDRRNALRRFARREFQAIVCCDLLTEGWDEPQVSCVVVCRPTLLRNRYAQMIGRGTRPDRDSGKVDCLVIDFAWETTSRHQLCTPVDLFDDSTVDDEVMRLAREAMAGVSQQPRDPQEAIEEAEHKLAERRRLNITLTGTKAVYKKIVYDPVGVGSLVGVTMKRNWDFNPRSPATPAQLQRLGDLGVELPHGLSKQGASKLIAALSKRREAGLATVRHIARLFSLGVDPEAARLMSIKEASEAIVFLRGQKVG